MVIREAIKIAYKKGYRVSDDGILYGLKGAPIVVRRRGNQRYPTFSVNVGKLTKSGVFGIPVHKFAAYCFYGDGSFQEGLVVRHINRDTCDISKENIKMGTPSDNNLDKPAEIRSYAARKARASQGYRAYNAKLCDDQVREIRVRYRNGDTARKLANEFGVSDVTIYNIVNKRRYIDVI